MTSRLTAPPDAFFAPGEKEMWNKSKLKKITQSYSESDINEKYERGERRILTEINREKLPSLVESLDKPGYMDIQPLYQRRKRWDKEKKSRLIESFLINIPIPPIVLYETQYNSYEVIDGQQRLTALHEFYNNKFELTGLELWSELNGLQYQQLPFKVKAGIDRRSISTVILITESTSDLEEAAFLKQLAFERINTGGIKLSKQEIRNCLLSGKFNELTLELSRNSIFMRAWNIPNEEEVSNLEEDISQSDNNLYKKMEDVELILRFFALRHYNNFHNKISDFLDAYTRKASLFTSEDITFLRNIFSDTIDLAYQIYDENLFKPFDPDKQGYPDRAYKEYYDAVMVGFSHHLTNANKLIEKKQLVVEATKQMLSNNNQRKLFTGEGSTKKGLQERMNLFNKMLTQVVED
jgi:Protein of unknown function DUF262